MVPLFMAGGMKGRPHNSQGVGAQCDRSYSLGMLLAGEKGSAPDTKCSGSGHCQLLLQQA